MSPLLFLVAIAVIVVLRGMSPEERARLVPKILSALRFGRDAIIKPPAGATPFYRSLKARTRWAVVTPAIVAAYSLIFVAMIFGKGAISETSTLVAWGGNIGPRTTNGEWWRLGSTLLVHVSLLHLLADTAGLLQVGLVVERMVGRLAYALVFLAAGAMAGLASLTIQPVSVHTGAAGAIFGVYGLLAASLLWGLIERRRLAMPLPVLKALWPGMALFTGYHWLTEGLPDETMKVGLLVGLVGGMLISAHVVADTPPARRVSAVAAATLAIVVALAAPLRGLADVSGVLATIRDTEVRTSRTYDEAIDRFKRGRLNAKDLAALADSFASELRAFGPSLGSLDNVPAEHQAMVSDAVEYLRLRQDSWRLRAEGLRAGRPAVLQKADAAEHAARTALEHAVASQL